MMKPETGDESIAPLIEELLGRLGEDPKRDGLVRTPQRVDKALRFLTSGYQMKVEQILNGALYEVKYDEMVVVRDIEFFSLCEHHMLPFYGKMHVAYLPQKKVIGLSKIPRIVDMFARRLQIQERLTQQVAQTVAGSDPSAGCGSDLRSAPLLHDDAGRGEAALGGDDERHAGGVPGSQRDAGRVSGAGESPDQRVLGNVLREWDRPGKACPTATNHVRCKARDALE